MRIPGQPEADRYAESENNEDERATHLNAAAYVK